MRIVEQGIELKKIVPLYRVKCCNCGCIVEVKASEMNMKLRVVGNQLQTFGSITCPMDFCRRRIEVCGNNRIGTVYDGD